MAEAIQIDPEAMRRGPLDGAALPAGVDAAVAVLPPAARMILRGGAAARAAASSGFGVALPEVPNRAATADQGARAALWLGPDEWLLLAPGATCAAVRAGLTDALAKLPYSLTDISHRQIGLELTGRLAARALSAGCPLDLRPSAFPAGMATRTIFLKAEIVLWRLAEQRFHVEVWRSFAPYLIGHLREATAGAAGL